MRKTVGCLTVMLMGLVLPTAGSEAPYGSKDFYPSPERPFGFRGDGSGCYPGATPVTEWQERTPEQWQGKAPKGSKNVVWRLRTPGWSDTQPLVIGDRIVGLCEPDIVFCVDANTGKMLWQDRVMAMFLPPLAGDKVGERGYDDAEAWRRQQVVDIARGLFVRGLALNAKREPWPSNELKSQMFTDVSRLRDRIGHLTTDAKVLGGFDAYVNEFVKGLANPSANTAPRGYLKPVMAAYKIALDQVWFGWVGHVQSTPVTDGQFIYMAFGQGMVACYDLNGERQWAWRDTEFQLKGKLYCDHTPSLVLVDGVLLVRNHFGDLMGIDPKTGTVLHATDIGPAYNHGAYTTPGVLRLTSPGGTKRTVVMTQHDAVIDPKTGELLARISKEGFADIGHGQPRMVVGNKVLIHSSKTVPPDKGPAVVVQINLADDGSVTTERVHGFAGMYFGNSPMALTKEGNLFGHLKLWDFQTGDSFPGAVAPERNDGGGVTIAGAYAFNVVGSRYVKQGGWRTSVTGCHNVGEPGTSTPVGGKRILDFQGAPADLNADTWLPAIEPGGKPAWFGVRNGGMTPSGNRLFAQAYGVLYCIGDPSMPYDWNPASRPAVITNSLRTAPRTDSPPMADVLASHPDPTIAALMTKPVPAAVKKLATADRNSMIAVFGAALAAGKADAAVEALAELMKNGKPGQVVGAIRAADVHAERVLKDEGNAEVIIDALKRAIRKGKGLVKFSAVQAVGRYGGLARSVLNTLRVEANGAQCPALAKTAMFAIDPKASTAISLTDSDDDDDGGDLLDDFDL